MPIVVYNYNKCNGNGSCAEVCPVNILEVSGNKRWCKPKDDNVTNKAAVKQFHDKVEKSSKPVNVVIKNDMPDCIICRACESSCPEAAITIEE